LIERFRGKEGELSLRDALLSQKLLLGNAALAEQLLKEVELQGIEPSRELIVQGAADNDIYFILAGKFEIFVNGRKVAERGPGDHVGEMAAILPSQRRSATVRSSERGVVAKISAVEFVRLGEQYAVLWRQTAKILAERLYQRNAHVTSAHEKTRVFVISSAEALPIARAVQECLVHDPFSVTVWTDGVFRASQYSVESLVQQLDMSDFAIAIAQADDLVLSRDTLKLTPRDNVLFELGLFIGRLGRHRSFLLEPLKEGVQLPSDLTGITTIPYRRGPDNELLSLVGPACNQLRRLFKEIGPA
jgi:CRP/FNR family cyclic AMP-dependent transcriptional regulator